MTTGIPSAALEKDDVPTDGGYDAARVGAGNSFDITGQVDSVGLTSAAEIPDSYRVSRASGDGDGASLKLGAGHCGHLP